MSSSDPYRELIATFALGALEGQERRELETHLSRCASCRAELERMSAIVSLLPRTVDPVQPSIETKRKLLLRVAEDLTQDKPAQEGRAGLFGGSIPVLPVGLTIAVAILIGLLVMMLVMQELHMF